MLGENEMQLRREIVYALHMRGLSNTEIVKRLQADPELRSLLENYSTPLWKVIRNDILAMEKQRHGKHFISEDMRNRALLQLAGRLDAVYREAWTRIEKATDGQFSVHDIDTLLNQARVAAEAKARALGVSLDGPAIEPGDGGKGGDVNNNLIFTDPAQFLEFVAQVKTARRLTPGDANPDEAIEVDADVVDVSSVPVS